MTQNKCSLSTCFYSQIQCRILVRPLFFRWNNFPRIWKGESLFSKLGMLSAFWMSPKWQCFFFLFLFSTLSSSLWVGWKFAVYGKKEWKKSIKRWNMMTNDRGSAVIWIRTRGPMLSDFLAVKSSGGWAEVLNVVKALAQEFDFPQWWFNTILGHIRH